MRLLRHLLLLSPFLLATAVAEGAARVAVSIAPLHSLVAGVTAGVSAPELLVPGGVSPHTYTLRPSNARALASADLVVWVGPDLERFLEKQLAGRPPQATVTALQLPGMTLHELREGGTWDGHPGHAHDHNGDAQGEEGDNEPDPHLWLDPFNARRLVEAVAEALARIDPANAAAYAANRERVAGRLDALHARLERQLAPVGERPFVVFHDAYRYLEERYDLAAAGSVTVSPEQAPGAKRLREIREKVRELGATCVFAEPQFRPSLVAVVLEGTAARRGVLDPVGAELASGPDLYFRLMEGLGDGLADCLGAP